MADQPNNTQHAPQIFAFDDQMVRTVDQAGEIWFVALDVCNALDIGNNRQALSRLDDDEKGVISNDTLGGRQELNAINESGLYSLILTSRKEEAKRFKRWVTHEVLPAIRKTGVYEHKPANQPGLVSLQAQSLKLLEGLKTEGNKQIRQFLYQQLQAVADKMGLQAPALDQIGVAAPDVPEAVTQFWHAYDTLTEQGYQLNHYGGGNVIAVSIKECTSLALKNGLPMPERRELLKLLKLSRKPRFKASTFKLRSRIVRKNMNVWLFETQSAKEVNHG